MASGMRAMLRRSSQERRAPRPARKAVGTVARSRVHQRRRNLHPRRRRRPSARRVDDRHHDVERLAEKLLVVDPFVVELVANTIELAVPPLVRRISEREGGGWNRCPGVRLDADDLGGRPRLFHVPHARGYPYVVAPLRAGFRLENLTLGERQVVRLPGAYLQIGRATTAGLAAIGRVARPVLRVRLETTRGHVGSLAGTHDARGGGSR